MILVPLFGSCKLLISTVILGPPQSIFHIIIICLSIPGSIEYKSAVFNQCHIVAKIFQGENYVNVYLQ